jgi:ABC-type cobalamin/Fe3+-siderophores transport system ATPase subunit
VLLLDELTSFLDAGDQASVLAAVRAAVDAGGVTAVWVRASTAAKCPTYQAACGVM